MSSVPLRIVLNGEPRDLAGPLTVAELLRSLQVPTVGVAVERNRTVVRRVDHDSCVLQDGDTIEIVQFVGGG